MMVQGPWPRPVLLPCDVVVLAFAVLAVVQARSAWRSADPHGLWRRVLADRSTLCALVLLASFGAVSVLDSVHFRRVVDGPASPSGADGRVSPDPGDGPVPVYATRTESLLDLLTARLATGRELSYSAPLAMRAMAAGAASAGRDPPSPAPRLRHGGAHLGDDAQRGADLLRRAAAGLGLGLAAAAAVSALAALGLARAGRTTWVAAGRRLARDDTALPLRAMLAMVALVGAVAGMAAALATGYHLAGTDRTGRDVLLQALKSMRTAIVIGGFSTAATVPPAVVLGIAAGYLGGWCDAAVRYACTVLASMPNVLLMSACMLLLQGHVDSLPEAQETALERADLRLFVLCLLLGLTTWTNLCRLLRAEARRLRMQDHVQAAIASGVGPWRIMRRHVLPNVAHLVLISATLDFSALVLYEAVLSFIGVGVDPVLPSYGGMIDQARSEIAHDPLVWWSFGTALVCMVALVFGANLVADGVRAALDPRADALPPRRRLHGRRPAA